MKKKNLLLRFECKNENFKDIIFEGGKYNRVSEKEMDHYLDNTLHYAMEDLIRKIVKYDKWGGIDIKPEMEELGRMSGTIPGYETTAKYFLPKGEAVFLCNGTKVSLMRHDKEKSVDDLLDDAWKNFDKVMSWTLEMQEAIGFDS